MSELHIFEHLTKREMDQRVKEVKKDIKKFRKMSQDTSPLCMVGMNTKHRCPNLAIWQIDPSDCVPVHPDADAGLLNLKICDVHHDGAPTHYNGSPMWQRIPRTEG